jgi:hypothetical protein
VALVVITFVELLDARKIERLVVVRFQGHVHPDPNPKCPAVSPHVLAGGTP